MLYVDGGNERQPNKRGRWNSETRYILRINKKKHLHFYEMAEGIDEEIHVVLANCHGDWGHLLRTQEVACFVESASQFVSTGPFLRMKRTGSS